MYILYVFISREININSWEEGIVVSDRCVYSAV